ncbi:MAG: hypothetical protein GY946_10295, partial [bacterium]|nr:hypothetical protein [bacterium]
MGDDDAVRRPPVSGTYQPAETADGWISVLALTEEQWTNQLIALDRPELLVDPRFITRDARLNNLQAFRDEMAKDQRLLTAETLRRLQEGDVPCGPLVKPEEVPELDQVVVNGTLVESNHPAMGAIRSELLGERRRRGLKRCTGQPYGLVHERPDLIGFRGMLIEIVPIPSNPLVQDEHQLQLDTEQVVLRKVCSYLTLFNPNDENTAQRLLNLLLEEPFGLSRLFSCLPSKHPVDDCNFFRFFLSQFSEYRNAS